MTTPPPRPKNARIIRRGHEIPLELVYDGPDAEGIHLWRSYERFYPEYGDRIRIDEMPAMCGITFGDPS